MICNRISVLHIFVPHKIIPLNPNAQFMWNEKIEQKVREITLYYHVNVRKCAALETSKTIIPAQQVTLHSLND